MKGGAYNIAVTRYDLGIGYDKPFRLPQDAQLAKAKESQKDACQQRKNQLYAGQGCQVVEPCNRGKFCQYQAKTSHEETNARVGNNPAGMVT